MPGIGTQSIPVSIGVVSGSPQPVTLSHITATVQQTGLPAGCSAANDFSATVTNINHTLPVNLGDNGDSGLDAGITAKVNVSMNETGANQNACAGATPQVLINAS